MCLWRFTMCKKITFHNYDDDDDDDDDDDNNMSFLLVAYYTEGEM